VTWVIAGAIGLVPSSLSIALFVNASRDGILGWSHVLRAAVIGSLVPLAACLTFDVWSAWAYLLFGESFQSGMHNTALVLLFAGVPIAINSALTAALRALGRVRDLVVAAGVTTVMVLVLAFQLLPALGLLGAAIAWLSGQAIGSLAFMGFALRARKGIHRSEQPIDRLSPDGSELVVSP
jgi:O-antigen/teichoic acid export membrane protein